MGRLLYLDVYNRSTVKPLAMCGMLGYASLKREGKSAPSYGFEGGENGKEPGTN